MFTTRKIIEYLSLLLLFFSIFISCFCFNVSADVYEVHEGPIELTAHQYVMWTLHNIEGGEISLWYGADMDETPHSDHIFVMLFSSYSQYQKYLETGDIESYWAFGGWQYMGDQHTRLPVTSPQTYYLVFDNTKIIVSLEEAINDIETEDDSSEWPQPISWHQYYMNDNQIVRFEITFDLDGESAYITGPTYYYHQLSRQLEQQEEEESAEDDGTFTTDTADTNDNFNWFIFTIIFFIIVIILVFGIYRYAKPKDKNEIEEHKEAKELTRREEVPKSIPKKELEEETIKEEEIKVEKPKKEVDKTVNYCPECGVKLTGSRKFCAECGTRLK